MQQSPHFEGLRDMDIYIDLYVLNIKIPRHELLVTNKASFSSNEGNILLITYFRISYSDAIMASVRNFNLCAFLLTIITYFKANGETVHN